MTYVMKKRKPEHKCAKRRKSGEKQNNDFRKIHKLSHGFWSFSWLKKYIILVIWLIACNSSLSFWFGGWLLVGYSRYPSNNNLMSGLHTRRTVPSHRWDPRKESIYNYWGPQVTTPLVGGGGRRHKMTVPTTQPSRWLASLGFLVQFETSCLVLILRRIPEGQVGTTCPVWPNLQPGDIHLYHRMMEHLLQQWVGRHLEVTGVLHGKSRSWSHPQQFPTDHSVRSRGMVQNCDQSHLAGDERQDHSYHPSSIHLTWSLSCSISWYRGCGSSHPTKSLCPILFHSSQYVLFAPRVFIQGGQGQEEQEHLPESY